MASDLTGSVFTIEETSRILKISRVHTYELDRRGKLPVLSLGKRLLVSRVGLEKMLEEAGKMPEAKGEGEVTKE